MKKCGVLILIMEVLFFSSCKKDLNTVGTINQFYSEADNFRIHPVPRRPLLPLFICIDSYDQLFQLLGSSQIKVRAVQLYNGITIQPGVNINSMIYEATEQTQPNSIFGSRFIVEWRFPGGDWQGNIIDVWSLGCVYADGGQPPFTNLKRGIEIIQINTCLFWSTDEYTGERIQYLIIE